MVESTPLAEVNYDESHVPTYTLPDPLVAEDGTPVTDTATWERQRRPEILELFAEHVYGRTPADPSLEMDAEVTESSDAALDGRATRRQVTLTLSTQQRSHAMHLLVYLPNAAARPCPAFVGLNFHGNHTVHADPAIHLPTGWMRDTGRADLGVVENRASETGRGAAAESWCIEMLIDRGYAVGTVYCGDLFPDRADGFGDSVQALFREEPERRAPDQWGAIGAWAWGLSRALDYVETDDDLDHRRTAVIGHSRLGKTALWAAAQDERFALAISNNSGCGGAALSRRRFGETVERINRQFPHWFCPNFHGYNGREDELPVDQHQLIALLAPRPVYVASAEEDGWADPRGERLSAVHASPVWRLYGRDGIEADDLPPANQPIGAGHIGYHLRTGGHGLTPFDWRQYLDFADRFLRP